MLINRDRFKVKVLDGKISESAFAFAVETFLDAKPSAEAHADYVTATEGLEERFVSERSAIVAELPERKALNRLRELAATAKGELDSLIAQSADAEGQLTAEARKSASVDDRAWTKWIAFPDRIAKQRLIVGSLDAALQSAESDYGDAVTRAHQSYSKQAKADGLRRREAVREKIETLLRPLAVQWLAADKALQILDAAFVNGNAHRPEDGICAPQESS